MSNRSNPSFGEILDHYVSQGETRLDLIISSDPEKYKTKGAVALEGFFQGLITGALLVRDTCTAFYESFKK
jgi:hypothetical protein